MEKPDYFMDLNMPQYGKVGLIEAKGLHYFFAMTKARGDIGKMFKYILEQILFVNDKPVDKSFLTKWQLKTFLI